MLLENLIIEELQQMGTVERIFRYNPINTLALAVRRVLDHEIYNYFNDFLTKLDDAIMYYNTTQYKIPINRIDIGELYNTSTLASANAAGFFEVFFSSVNSLFSELLKSAVDEAMNNGLSLTNVNSTITFANLNHNSEHFKLVKQLILDYQKLLLNKPINVISLISSLKRYRVTTGFNITVMNDLDTRFLDYVKQKLSTDKYALRSNSN